MLDHRGGYGGWHLGLDKAPAGLSSLAALAACGGYDALPLLPLMALLSPIHLASATSIGTNA